ncbi:MAG: tRNA (adenosine(37)-N6)-threonylcarbamoyltransferase complex transferase subunit TsaD [Actinomycetota bacterium]|nr:tRNA (adenosine(37)-N6)-threonylcarbamoyltransferase complex transferase subunit TsaD [Actinomycetota bacterium]
MSGLILGIETSCDETAAALVDASGGALSSVIASQISLHRDFGGVVPELASREHAKVILSVIEHAFTEAGREFSPAGLEAVAVTKGPGLAGSLMVGVAAAKALAIGWGLPLVGVNHLEGHIFAIELDYPEVSFPMAMLVVSGGHTMIVRAESRGNYQILGETVDDAAGEAFDKVARLLGLGYPGGPEIERVAMAGDPYAIRFPRARTKGEYDFSFSGPKTAVVNYVKSHPGAPVADVAASFQASVTETLVEKTVAAAAATGCASIGLSGGVGANTLLRALLAQEGEKAGMAVYVPAKRNCTDNGAMIASAGRFLLERFGPSDPELDAMPSLRLT